MRYLSLVLALIVLGSCLAGCRTDPASETAASPKMQEQTESQAGDQGQTEPKESIAAEEAAPEGFLYLTVSQITFSVVGEQEDIYIGTVPREDVIWKSEDEQIVTFDNGIACAAGVGQTKIYAEYNGQRIECTAGCLAQNEEELAGLDAETRCSPKRIPPEVSDEPLTFFDDSVMIGDSITYVMYQYNNKSAYLGKPKFLCRGSASVNGFLERYHQIYFRGVECNLEDAIAGTGAKKAYFMLGQNDIGYQEPEVILQRWEALLARIREKSPDIEIYIQSCTPAWAPSGTRIARNDQMDTLNSLLKDAAGEWGVHYVELAGYMEDHENKLVTAYCSDMDVHMNEEGSYLWMRVLKAHAEYQMLLQARSGS